MTDRDALFRAILAHPHEDTPRLVYADWLGENGEPDRAEFIRVQCELARLEAKPGDRVAVIQHPNQRFNDLRACSMLDREQELWRRGNLLWGNIKEVSIRPILPPFAHGWSIYTDRTRYGSHEPQRSAIVRRGFVDEVRLPLAAFLEHAEALFEDHPITKVALTDREPARYIHLFRWWSDGDAAAGPIPDTSRLPLVLTRRLEPGGYYFGDDAHRDLSAACVAWGRELAGLPAIPFDTVRHGVVLR